MATKTILKPKKVWQGKGRKPKDPKELVSSKGVYLTAAEWRLIEKKYGSATIALRQVVLPALATD